MVKYISFLFVLAGTVFVWSEYFEAKEKRDEMVEIAEKYEVESLKAKEDIHLPAPKRQQLTDNFWKWEAQGRLNLIDAALDDEKIVSYRLGWKKSVADKEKLAEVANYLIALENKAYGVSNHFDAADVSFVYLRGDANGLYVPTDHAIYLNNRMKWDQLPFERFAEVIFHENMHHIMTRMGDLLGTNDPLFGDFATLNRAAYAHQTIGMAQDQTDIYQANPQELVAWRTQRVARYAGIFGSNLDALEMTARTQEIRHIRDKAGF